MASRKYKKLWKASQDRDQATLVSETEKGIRAQHWKIAIKSLDMNQQYMCPFCLGIAKLRKYLISTSKGIHKSLVLCPECKNQCKMSTLTADMTPEQYADFAYGYVGFGFWQKVPFDKWKERLRKIGWSYRFWKRYKQLKGEDIDRPETLIEKQERMRWECQRCGEVNPPNTTFCKYCGHRLIESYG